MSKSKPPKKVVVTTKDRPESTSSRSRAVPASRSRVVAPPTDLIFERKNYVFMGIGIGLIVLGLLLMSGGAMPSPDVWEPERIYSFRRTVLAPAVILAGLAMEIVAIFTRNPDKATPS